MEEKYQQARHLFFQTELTQIEIAKIIGIHFKTLYRWVKQEDWKRIKTAARQMPAAITERLYTQLLDLNDSICSREPGKRIPTMEEADLNRKLIISVTKMKAQVSKQDNIQVLTNFTSWLNTKDTTLAAKTKSRADEYITGSFKNGHHPYEMEYEYEEVEDRYDVEVPGSIVPFPSSETPPAPEETPIECTTEFEGYYREEFAKGLTEGPGIYCVYESTYNERHKKVEVDELLYIGEAENVKEEVEAALTENKWRSSLHPGKELCFTCVKTYNKDKKRIATALIHNAQPLLNTEYKEQFPYASTTIKTSGQNDLLSRCFITERINR